MSKDKELKPLNTNLLKQNCFLRECVDIPFRAAEKITKYESIDEVTTDKGVELRYTEHDYPITPEYVNSFAESADYRRDPISAIANGGSRKNLGDITDMQNVSAMDTEQARNLYEQLKQKFGKAEELKQNNNENKEVNQ